MFVAVHMSRSPGVRATATSATDQDERQRWDGAVADDSFVKGLIDSMEGDQPAEARTTIADVRAMLSDLRVVISTHPDNVKARMYALPLIRLTPLLLRCRWTLWVAPEGRTFLTCDRPLMMLSSDPARLDPDLTLHDNSHITAFFPLTRTIALEMKGWRRHSLDVPPIGPGARVPIFPISPSQITVRNQTVVRAADRYIFCSDQAQAEWASTHVKNEDKKTSPVRAGGPS